MSLEAVRRMPAADYVRYRRFYALCPFGPARLDLNAWLTAQHVWAGWNGKMKSMADAVLWFGKVKKRKPKRPKPIGTMGRDLVAAAKARGEKIIILKPGDKPNGQG